MNSLTDEEIERINRFIDLKSYKSNRKMIKQCIFIIIVLFMFFVGQSIMFKFNLLTSWWMIFAVFAVLVIAWGIYLLISLEKHPFQFFLFWGTAGVYYTVEFYSLGISYGLNAHADIRLFYLVIILNFIALLFLLWYRVQLLTGKKKIKSGLPNYRIMIPGILILSPVLILILDSVNASGNNSSFILFFLLGFIESAHFLLFLNYFVAKKYCEYIHRYDEKEELTKQQKRGSR